MVRSRGRTSLQPAERRARRAAVEDLDEVLAAAARFLEARSRSAAEVRRRLTSAGYQPGLVDRALARLTAQGYLDDKAFARAWVESRDRARPRGERALRGELAQKGIARQIVDAVLGDREASASGADREAAASADEIAAARLLERHRRALMREEDPRKRRQRAYALLARSSFDPETSRTVAAMVAVAEWIADDALADDSDAT